MEILLEGVIFITTTKDRIIETAAQIMFFKGYTNTGLKEILEEARIPKGSFYYHFKSKEDLALQIVDYYANMFMVIFDNCINNDNLNPLESLKCFFKEFHNKFESFQCKGGCPLGNFGQELSDTEENIRVKIDNAFSAFVDKIFIQLRKSQELGFLGLTFDARDYAEFIFNSWEGALLRAKVKKSMQPLELFLNIIFELPKELKSKH